MRLVRGNGELTVFAGFVGGVFTTIWAAASIMAIVFSHFTLVTIGASFSLVLCVANTALVVMLLWKDSA